MARCPRLANDGGHALMPAPLNLLPTGVPVEVSH